MVTQAGIARAHQRISPYLRLTPTLTVEAGLFCKNAVSMKLELFQHTGSFKARGAFNALLSNSPGAAGVVAFSGGNHGAAVAYAASTLGVRSTIFVPDFAGPVKIDRMRHFGAQVIVIDDEFSVIHASFMEYAAQTGALAVHPFDDEFVVCGQGSTGLEIGRQLPDIDSLLVSVGGGGLIGGITAWFEDRVKIVAVETTGTASLENAFSNTPEVEIVPSGIAANALGGTRLGEIPRKILARWRPQSVTVSDADVIKAQNILWSGARIIAEPGASTALAALTSGAYEPRKGENVGVLLCGGNALPGWFVG
ncbi:MAG: threonine/serine dehydratase [Paracoccaceae bacterium]